jgi:hypothetical protein
LWASVLKELSSYVYDVYEDMAYLENFEIYEKITVRKMAATVSHVKVFP